MPCIKTIDSIRIYIYVRDHNPPHFHVIYAEYEELILIENFNTYIGLIPEKQRKKVINWAIKNQKYLMDTWTKLNLDK